MSHAKKRYLKLRDMSDLILLGEHLWLRLPMWTHKISHSYPYVWRLQIICDPTRRFCELVRILGQPPRLPVRKKVWPIFWVGFGKSTLRGHPSQGGSLSSSSSGVEAIVSEYSFALPMLAPFSNPPRWHHNDVYGVGYDSRFVVGYMGLLYPSSTQLV